MGSDFENDALKIFLTGGKRSDYSESDVHYVLAFRRFQSGDFISWNWASFFLGAIHAAYRKNWIAFVFSLLAPFSLGHILFALFGDYLYFLKFKHTKESAEFAAQAGGDKENFLAKKGGTNAALAIVLLLLCALLVSLIVFNAAGFVIQSLPFHDFNSWKL